MNDALEVVQALMCCACNNPDHHDAAAVLAAASGPWTEQLDAANARAEKMERFEDALALPQLLAETAAERDQALLRLKRIIELEPVAHAAEQIRESDGSFTTEIAGVRLEKCDEYGRTKTTAERDAALARNVELQHEVEGLAWRNQQLTERLEQTND